MLKAAGVDQFSISARLAALDADHVAHLTRMYQKQASVVARHVDDLVFVESLLVGSGWSRELDDVLTAQLPMVDEQFKAFEANGRSTSGRLQIDVPAEQARLLIVQTPMAITSLLAAVAVVRHGWINDSDQSELAATGFRHDDQRVVDDAALAFAHWRTLHLPMGLVSTNQLIDALYACTHTEDAAIGLRLLGEDVELSRNALASSDPDRAFAAALALGAVEPLTAALSNDDRRYAAALALAKQGHTSGLGGVFDVLLETLAGDTEFSERAGDQLASIFNALSRNKQPFPELRDALWKLAKNDTKSARRARAQAIHLLVLNKRPDDALSLISLGADDTNVIQEVLQRMELGPADLELVARCLVDRNKFSHRQYGVTDLATNGSVRDNFVPSVWSRCVDDEQRIDLLRFTEEQLNARGDETLHQFVMSIVWADGTVTLRAQAWWVLLRWYGRSRHASKGPLVFDESVITSFFPSVADFFGRFIALMKQPDLESELSLLEVLSNLLRYSPVEGLPSVLAEKKEFERFVSELTTMMADETVRMDLRSSAVRFLENVTRADESWTPRVLEVLDRLTVGDLEFECSATAARIRRE
jgi:hypothetical protein